MPNSFRKHIEKYYELYIVGFIFLILFLLPVFFTRVRGEISWHHVVKIWEDQLLLIPLFVLHHWLFVPRFLVKNKYLKYFLSTIAVIAIFTLSYYYFDEVLNTKHQLIRMIDPKRPTPIAPYAHLLMYSLLICCVDAGLLFSKKWYETEQKKQQLEIKNSEMKLEILRNQISPHFLMNTLNNIYSLAGNDTPKAKEAIMKLSKLMRYMLYENQSGKVKLSKEFEFIQSYVDLMKLRFSNERNITISFPDNYDDLQIPSLLFISFIENAFKYGASYENDFFIHINFETKEDMLCFSCFNSINSQVNTIEKGGLGLKNTQNRLNLLFGKKHQFQKMSNSKNFEVKLEIPLC